MFTRVVAGLRAGAGHPSSTLIPSCISAITFLGATVSETLLSQNPLRRCFSSADGLPYLPLAGQPTHATHPQLIAPDELTPGITAAEYRDRRHRLAQMLPPGAVAILPAAGTTYMSGVIPWPYRQDPDFFYLTGLMQHGLALISRPKDGSKDCHFTLFIDPPNPNRDRWDGATVSREAAQQLFGADEVYTCQEMPRRLQALALAAASTPGPPSCSSSSSASSSSFFSSLSHHPPASAAPSSSPRILYDVDRIHAHHYSTITASLKPALEAHGRVAPLRPLLHSMRLVKSPAEVALMRTSAGLASAAVRHCMAATGPGTTEYGLAAAFEYAVKAAGAQRLSYPSVVAGGPDACTIHYSRNDKVLADGQVVLMDAGAEYWGYVSDVTRTWPVGGTFTGPQRDVYSVVLEAHQRCLAACRPGSSIRELHLLCIDILSEGLRDLRILPGASLQDIRNHHYREFFWHSLGHYLGLDTHDTHLVGHDRKLAEGAVITVEPGLYIPDDPRFGVFRGIGVRIEDDVLLTAAGCEVLSDKAPVAISEVEALAGSAVRTRASPVGILPIPPRIGLAATAMQTGGITDEARLGQSAAVVKVEAVAAAEPCPQVVTAAAPVFG